MLIPLWKVWIPQLSFELFWNKEGFVKFETRSPIGWSGGLPGGINSRIVLLERTLVEKINSQVDFFDRKTFSNNLARKLERFFFGLFSVNVLFWWNEILMLLLNCQSIIFFSFYTNVNVICMDKYSSRLGSLNLIWMYHRTNVLCCKERKKRNTQIRR